MANDPTHTDLIIIGGGPAGLSAALWAAELGLDAVLFEQGAEVGGQLLWTFNAIRNHLGVEAANGLELRDKFLQSVQDESVRRITGATVANADLAQKTVTFAGGANHRAQAIIIATGVRRRKLGVPGEAEFQHRGILVSGARMKDEMSGRTVLIVGGGDAAVENALILSEPAERVIVVHRRGKFTARKDFVQRAHTRPNVEFCMNSRVTRIVGNEIVEGAEVEDLTSGRRTVVGADAILIRVGVVPNTEIFQDQLELDGSGYVCIDAGCRTNVDGVFAIGDVSSRFTPTISNAVGQGATAARLSALLLDLDGLP